MLLTLAGWTALRGRVGSERSPTRRLVSLPTLIGSSGMVTRAQSFGPDSAIITSHFEGSRNQAAVGSSHWFCELSTFAMTTGCEVSGVTRADLAVGNW